MPDEIDAVPQSKPSLQDQDLVIELTLEYLDVLNGSSDALPVLDDLSPELRGRVLQAWSSIDRLITDEPLPPLSADPTAIALGVVPAVLLDRASLRHARQARNMRPSDVAAGLQHLGWQISTADVFAWERRSQRLAPALLTDIATTLRVSEGVLTAPESPMGTADSGEDTPPDAISAFLQVLYSDDLNDLVQQWAQLLELDPATAREDLQRRLSTIAHRGAHALTTHQWKAVLTVLLASERARREQSEDPHTD